MDNKNVVNSILDLVGNTPLVKLQSLSKKYGCTVYGKLECCNPSLSIKDRVVKYIIEKAEKEGVLKPGMTLTDATSGNTGLALAQIALMKGYKCTITVKDTSADAKINQLLAYGAEVIKCPAKAASEDPRSYYSVAKSLAENDDNVYYMNQNFNKDNYWAHYHGTGTEIWNQTNGKVTHFFASASTGGTISGSSAFLKEQNKNITVSCADSKGSVLKPYFESGVWDRSLKRQTILEGVGKDIIPGTFSVDHIDHFFEVNDDLSIAASKQLLKQEGIFVGGSSGAAIQIIEQYNDAVGFKPSDVVVAVLPDHGIKYLSKLYNPMRKAKNVADLVSV